MASSQGQVLALVSRGADLQTLLLCDKDLLARYTPGACLPVQLHGQGVCGQGGGAGPHHEDPGSGSGWPAHYGGDTAGGNVLLN